MGKYWVQQTAKGSFSELNHEESHKDSKPGWDNYEKVTDPGDDSNQPLRLTEET